MDSTLGARSALKKGSHAKITGGPFMGIEGIVSGLKGANKVYLNIELIGQAVAVEVGSEFIEIID